MIEILKLSDIAEDARKEQILSQIQEIFFLSTSIKEFSSPERKNAFFKTWCGDYISFYPEQFSFMLEDGKVLGYLSACRDSKMAAKNLSVAGYNIFFDLFERYPAHFHINFHPSCRGRGLGSQIVSNLIQQLRSEHFPGVHIVTSPDAANVSFYQRLGFTHLVEREFNQKSLLFMGNNLE